MIGNTLNTIKFFLAPVMLPLTFYFSINKQGFLAYSTVLFVFFIVPILDLVFPPSKINPKSKEEERELKSSKIYDAMVLMVLPVQVLLLVYFLYMFKANYASVSLFTKMGWVLSMGVNCGVLGINVGHELGHRIGSWQRFVAKALLWTSLRMSFYIEHNWGHHRDVSTPKDPASAKKNELVYTFIFKSLFKTWLNSWAIQKELLQKRKVVFFSIYNDILWFTIIQWITILFVFIVFGWQTTLAYLAAAFSGMLLLELVNYIEHYGLQRKQDKNGRYERTLPIHSWNSSHSFSGAALFNLSRHSDHHHIPGRPYQILRNYEETPNMPAGYAGMILLSFVSPLWFFVMNKKLEQLENSINEDFSMDSF